MLAPFSFTLPRYFYRSITMPTTELLTEDTSLPLLPLRDVVVWITVGVTAWSVVPYIVRGRTLLAGGAGGRT